MGDPAPHFEAADSENCRRTLAEFWADRPALLVLWRHFGCGCGIGRAKRLSEEYPTLVDSGANVVVIGQGEPARAACYKAKFGVPSTILVDPDEHIYRAYGLVETSPRLLLGRPLPGPEFFENLVIEHRAKRRPVADNPFLLPGEFVVDRSGRLRLTYRYQYCDNYPDPDTLADSIREAATPWLGPRPRDG